jgi:hypothetical protein
MITAKTICSIVHQNRWTWLCISVLIVFTAGVARLEGQQFAGGFDKALFAPSTPGTYSDQFSNSCRDASPFAEMNPLACKGVVQPADTSGRCSLAGLRLVRRSGNMCFYSRVGCRILSNNKRSLDFPKVVGELLPCVHRKNQLLRD